MDGSAENRAQAATLPDADLFDTVMVSSGGEKKADFDRQRALLAVHETAEAIAPTHAHSTTTGSTAAQMTLGPFTSNVDGGQGRHLQGRLRRCQ